MSYPLKHYAIVALFVFAVENAGLCKEGQAALQMKFSAKHYTRVGNQFMSYPIEITIAGKTYTLNQLCSVLGHIPVFEQAKVQSKIVPDGMLTIDIPPQLLQKKVTKTVIPTEVLSRVGLTVVPEDNISVIKRGDEMVAVLTDVTPDSLPMLYQSVDVISPKYEKYRLAHIAIDCIGHYTRRNQKVFMKYPDHHLALVMNNGLRDAMSL